MTLPSEIDLDILHFLDYNSLVAVKRVTSSFLSVVVHHAERLALRQKFGVDIYADSMTLSAGMCGVLKIFRFLHANHETFKEASLALAACVGHHNVKRFTYMNGGNRQELV